MKIRHFGGVEFAACENELTKILTKRNGNNGDHNSIHFGFSVVDLSKIIDLARKADNNAIVNVAASSIDPDDADIGICNEFSLTVNRDTDFVFIHTQQQANDDSLLPLLSALQKMDPEDISIAVSAKSNTRDFCWEIMILFDEGVATVFYDRSIGKREAQQIFGDCFK